jgi:hypothetical protein
VLVYRELLRIALSGLLALGVSAMPLLSQQASAQSSPPGAVKKFGVDLDVRSHGRMMGDARAIYGTLVPNDQPSVVPTLPNLGLVPRIQSSGNIQVNDGNLDKIMTFSGTRPFVSFTQSETALAVHGQNIVAVYNTTAFGKLVQQGQNVYHTQLFVLGFSNSTDGGQTWKSGSLPPVPGSSFTDGDPSLAVDRQGNIYAAGLGEDAKSRSTVQVNTSQDGGSTWSDAVVVQQDDGSDKPWIAVGPDPALKNCDNKNCDNVYVTWRSIQSKGDQLRFGRLRLIDSGATWSTKIIPVSDPNLPDSLSHSVPFVDVSTGILYIPFLHFGPESFDQDFIRILISADAGQTFSFVNFNVTGAPDPTLLPIMPAGDVTDCGTSGGFRLTIHAGPDVGGGRQDNNGIIRPRFVQASRLIHQPAFAARNGRLYLAWLSSRSDVFGDGAAGSDILFMRSDDGGASWTGPMQVNPTVPGDIHHVLPTLAINEEPSDLYPTIYISYYTQHSDETVDVDMASSRNGGRSFTAVRLTSAPFALAPTNIPLPTKQDPFNTTNYDRTFFPCYNLGEYMNAKVANGTSYVLWSDSRNTVTESMNLLDPLSGQMHPQQDVFFQAVKAK